MAIATSRARLLRAHAPLSLEVCGAPSVSEGAAPRVELTRDGGRDLVVKLVAPSEPLAWAVDPAPRDGAPFECAWHSERALGVRPTAAKSEAFVIDRGGPIAVRVYGDDGSLSTTTAPATVSP